jgi:hypothetical protein
LFLSLGWETTTAHPPFFIFDNYVAEVEEVLGAGFGVESLVAGFDSATGFDSVAGFDSPPAAGAASLAGLSVELDAALGA